MKVASNKPLYASTQGDAFSLLPSLPSPSFSRHREHRNHQERVVLQSTSKMSSPSHRRQRSSQSSTPRRSARQSEASNTPRDRQSQLASSPLFFQSSSPGPRSEQNGANGDVSSPLRQMSHSQSTNGPNGAAPSSPLRQMTETQTTNDPQRTPRARAGLGGGELLLSMGLFLAVTDARNLQNRPRYGTNPAPAQAGP